MATGSCTSSTASVASPVSFLTLNPGALGEFFFLQEAAERCCEEPGAPFDSWVNLSCAFKNEDFILQLYQSGHLSAVADQLGCHTHSVSPPPRRFSLLFAVPTVASV